MNNILATIAIVTAVFLPALVVQAGPIVRSGESISIDATQVLKGDFYGFSPTVTLSGSAENDVYIAGGTVTINASVAQDLTVVGGVVQVHGDVGDDLRIMGGEVTIAKNVKGDVAVFGGTLTILSTATVEGDVLFFGGDLAVEGGVVGGIHGNAATVRLNSEIGGDISLKTKTAFTVGDRANILGNVQYESASEIVRAQDAIVVGEVHRIDVASEEGVSIFKLFILYVVILLFSTLTVYLTLRKYVDRVVAKTLEAPGISGLVGIGVFLILPFIAGLLFVSMIGAFVGVVLFASYIILSICAIFGASILLGVYIQKILSKKTGVTPSTIVLGAVSLVLLGFIPVIGGIGIFALTLIAFGGICLSLFAAIRS